MVTEGIVEQAEFGIEIPLGCPTYLAGLLSLLGQTTTPAQAADPIRDALGFLTRYFGGVASAALAPANENLLRRWLAAKTTLEAESQIEIALGSLAAPETPLYHSFRSVFFSSDNRPYRHTDWVRVGRHRLSQWLRDQEAPTDEDTVEHFFEILRSWVGASRDFFADCRHRYYKFEGGCQLGTHLGEGELSFRLPLRVRDHQRLGLDRPAAGADATYRPTAVMPVDTSALGQLVQEMLERTGKRAVQERVFTAPEPRIQLEMRVDEVELVSGPFGVPRYRGRLTVINTTGDSIEGRLVGAFSGLNLSQRSFVGSQLQVDYTLDPGYRWDELDGERVVVLAGKEKAFLELRDLLPPEPARNMSESQAAALLLTPGIFSLLYLLLSYVAVWRKIPSDGEALIRMAQGAVTSLQLQMTPAASQLSLVALTLAILAPVVTAYLFKKVRRSTLGPVFCMSLALPTVGFLLASCSAEPPLASQMAGLESLDPFYLLPYVAVLNLTAATYLFLATERFLDRWLSQEHRILLPVVLSTLGLTVIGAFFFL